MTDTNTRFVADNFLIHDTETNKYLGFTFTEAATGLAEELNAGTFDVNNPFVVWVDREDISDLSEEELHNERAMTIALASVTGVELPDYAVKWGIENGIINE